MIGGGKLSNGDFDLLDSVITEQFPHSEASISFLLRLGDYL